MDSIRIWIEKYGTIICGCSVFLICMIIILLIRKENSEYYKKHAPELHKIQEKLTTMIPYFTPDQQRRLKKLKIRPDIKSYTVNKHDMHLCLEDDNGSYYDDNLLIYVTLHELAHIFCDEIGHTKNFYKIFDKLTDIAEKVKIYDSSIALPKEYCGITI